MSSTVKTESSRFPLTGLWWASFDWARSPYYYVVKLYVFSAYFAETVIADSTRGQTIFSSTVTIGGAIMAILAPFLGGYMDRGGAKKPVLIGLLLILASASAGLAFVVPGAAYSVPLGMVLLIIAGCAFSISELIHNALLPAAGNHKQIPMISGMGLSMGSSAAILVLIIIFILTQYPPFGLEAQDIARLSGVICAVWMLVFLAPFYMGMPDFYIPGARWKTARFHTGKFSPVASTRELFRNFSNIMRFLMARMIFMDGLTALFTITAVYVSGVLGWSQGETAIMGIVATCSAILGGFLGGLLDRKFDPRRAILIELFTVTGIFLFQISMQKNALFFGLITIPGEGSADALFSGPTDMIYLATIVPMAAFIIAAYSSCRTLLVKLSPPDKIGYFFGIYAMTSTITVWIGPGIVAAVTAATQSQQIGFGSLIVLFVAGSALMMRVRDERHTESASGAAPQAV